MTRHRISELRGAGLWEDALELALDPLTRADVLNEQALFSGDVSARDRAAHELDRAEALLLLGRGRILHGRFLASGRQDADPAELEHFERALELARGAGDAELESWATLWIGLYHQVVAGDGDRSRPFFDRAYDAAAERGDKTLMSYATRHLAWEDEAAGDHDHAWARWEESVQLRREEGFLPGVAAGLFTLGEAAAEHGRIDDARRLLTEAREVAAESHANVFRGLIDDALARLSSSA